MSEVGGIVKFGDIVEGVTMTEKLDEVTGLSRKVIIESRAADLRPRISIKHPQSGETLKLPASTLDARCDPLWIQSRTPGGETIILS